MNNTMATFEQELQELCELFLPYERGKDDRFYDLREKFIEKYDPEKQPKPTDVQTEVIKKTTQFDTLDNPTHIVHPLGFEFAVKDAINTAPGNYYWIGYNGKTIANYFINSIGTKLSFMNPFANNYYTDFYINNLILNLPNE